MNQMTLAAPFTLKGKGLHTGIEITATFRPAPENHGYKFRRTDLEGQPEINAVAENVVDTTRGTVLGKNDVVVSTVEHALAALYAAGIDNCLIDVDGPELPIYHFGERTPGDGDPYLLGREAEDGQAECSCSL